jgi:hypothetical protein
MAQVRLKKQVKYVIYSCICIVALVYLLDDNLFVLNTIQATHRIAGLTLQRNTSKMNLSCELIFKQNTNEIEKAEGHIKSLDKHQIDNSNYIFHVDYCQYFRQLRMYDEYHVEEEEVDFPLAFAILTHENVEQFERLLKLIYRPHNVYCVHMDLNSPALFHQAVQSVVQCFDNVFIATKLENVVYAGMTRLRADLNCMADLVDSKYTQKYRHKRRVDWKYYLNVASSEFPLKTNLEITRILRLFNGANDIEVMRYVIESRVFYKWKAMFDKNEKKFYLENTGIRKPDPPHNFTIVKGLAYGVFSLGFVKFILNDKHANDLLEWMADIYSPDEV